MIGNRLRTVVVAALAGWIAFGDPLWAQVPDSPAGVKVTGFVLEIETETPISGALVTIVSGDNTYSGVSDGEGKFVFENIAAGMYLIEVRAAGYVAPGAVGTGAGRLTVEAGVNVEDLTLHVVRPGAISGRLTGADQKPIAGAAVTALRLEETGGDRTLALVANGTTNEAGQYRISGLSPGTYFLRARSRLPGTIEEIQFFYPGVWAESQAVPLNVEAGTELTPVDFSHPH